jgi:CTP synthase
LKDSYKSIAEAFTHAAVANNCKVNLKWIHSESLDQKNIAKELNGLGGILVAPGFGSRGIEGKIEAIKYARENNVPFFGICLGMQCAVIEFARNVLGYKDAHSFEMNPETSHPVIHLMEEQKIIENKGGTMRLGAYKCKIKEGSKVANAYNKSEISERHRHRYEFNNAYLADFEKNGMVATGFNPETNLVEIVEIPNHKWFVGVQFHPEYKSTVENPHPLFSAFIKAVKG